MTSISMLNTQINRLETEIVNLNKKIGTEKKKQADAINKGSKAQEKLLKAKTQASINSAVREVEIANKENARSLKSQSDLMTQLARKSEDLAKKRNELSKEQKKESEKILKEQQAQAKQIMGAQKRLENQLNISQIAVDHPTPDNKKYDVFVSHASEDKHDFVRPLTEALKAADINVWYDEASIPWGGSIRQSIDKGLANSRFGLVVISKAFLDKYWTQYEMDGIFQKEARNGEQALLPIWHHVTKNEILDKSPSLADRRALNSTIQTIDEIVEEIKVALNFSLS